MSLFKQFLGGFRIPILGGLLLFIQPGLTIEPSSGEFANDSAPSMTQIIQVLTFQGGYNTNLVMVSTLLLGVAAGLVGVFVLLRKRSLVSDALAHATLPGLAVAFFAASALGLSHNSMPLLLSGAAVSGILGVVSVHWLLRVTRLREDAVIGLVLSIFFGAGTVLLSIIQNIPGSKVAGIEHFIYGQTAAMNSGDTFLMAGIAIAAVVMTCLFYKELALTCFNAPFAQVCGWPVSMIDLLMMSLLVLVTIAGLQAVGLILVVALLIIPPVSARFWTNRLGSMVIISGLIGGISGYFGSAISALLPGYPAGAVIVLMSGVLFGGSLLCAPRRGLMAALYRRLYIRLGITTDILLKNAFLLNPSAPKLSRSQLLQIKKQCHCPLWLWPCMTFFLKQRRLGIMQAGQLHVYEQGADRGRQVARNHQLLEQYLISYPDHAHHVDWTIDQVEQVFDPEMILELEHLLLKRGVEVHQLKQLSPIKLFVPDQLSHA